MARLILDTTVLVASERPGSRLNALVSDDDDVVIAAITAAELLVGLHLADDTHRQRRAAFVEAVTTIPFVDYDLDVARFHAGLLAHAQRSGRPRGAHDLLIAATAAATRRTIVSGDAAAFSDLPGVSHLP